MVQEPDFLREKPKNTDPTKRFLTPGTILLMIALVTFIAILGLQLFRQNQVQPLPGHAAPEFELVSYDGISYRLSELRGTIVVVNLWASWCVPCHTEAPDLEQIHLEYADRGVLLIGVNWLDVENEAFAFMNRYHITYPNAPDVGEKFFEAYNIQGPPETFVIDRNGIIAASFIGLLTYDQLANALDDLLARGGA